MKRIVLALAVLVAACGDNEQPFTFGDSYYDVAGAYCFRANQCGYNDDIPVCWEHAYFHGCRVAHDCDVVLPESARELTVACTEAVLAQECGPALYWASLPEACDSLIHVWQAR